MKKSNHAQIRCQQRGIKYSQIELILKYGSIRDKHGAYECYIPRNTFNQIIADYKKQIQDLECISRSNKTLILKEDTIITAYNKFHF